MLKFIYCIDRNGLLGINEIDPSTGETSFRQPIHCEQDKKHFLTNTKGKTIILGGNTMRSLFDEGIGVLKDRHHIVLTRDPELVAKLREYDNVEMAHSPVMLKMKIADPNKEFVCIGGAKLFKILKNEVDTHIVTEFDTYSDIEASPGKHIVELIHTPIPGSCKSGWVNPRFTRIDCSKFESVDQHGNPIVGYFSEYAVN